MKGKYKSHFCLLILSFFVLFFATGCPLDGPTPPPPPKQTQVAPACPIPPGNNLADVIEKTKAVLRNSQCTETFDGLYENLLNVGREDSKKENRALMQNFFAWCIDEGVLGRKTARRYFGEYFSTALMCLPKYPSMCGICGERLAKLKTEIDNELLKKQMGFVWVCDNNDEYKKGFAKGL